MSRYVTHTRRELLNLRERCSTKYNNNMNLTKDELQELNDKMKAAALIIDEVAHKLDDAGFDSSKVLDILTV